MCWCTKKYGYPFGYPYFLIHRRDSKRAAERSEVTKCPGDTWLARGRVHSHQSAVRQDCEMMAILFLFIWTATQTSSCCGARKKLRPIKRACFLPTAATRSARFICHRQRSHRSPFGVPPPSMAAGIPQSRCSRASPL